MEENRNKPWNFHTCKVCPYRSKSGLVMCKHVILHGKRTKTNTFMCNSDTPEMYDCGLCEFEADLKVTSSEHFRVEHEEKEANEMVGRILQSYQCKNCNFQTHSVLVLTYHVVNYCNSSKELDESKSKEVSRDKDYSDQWYEFKSEKVKQWKYYKCKHCNFQCKLLGNIKKHVKTSKHLDPDSQDVECQKCFFKTKTKLELERHITDSHKDKDDLLFECEHCSYVSQNKKNFRTHIQRHTKTWMKCQHCSYQTAYQRSLDIHNKNMHEVIDPLNMNWFECGQCSFKTKTKTTLKKHISKIHGTRFRCVQCTFKSTSEKSVNEHVFSVHNINYEDKSLIKCTQCPYVTKLKQCLKSHILRLHTSPDQVKWFKCGHCEHKTKFKYDLKTHILTRHTDPSAQKWFNCDLCSYKSVDKTLLRRHTSRCHTKKL